MVNYRCRICNKQFSTRYGLTQHCNAKHSGRTAPSSQNIRHQQLQAPQYDANLWNTPITIPLEQTSTILAENPVSQNDEEMEDVISENNTNINVMDLIEPQYNLQSRIQNWNQMMLKRVTKRVMKSPKQH